MTVSGEGGGNAGSHSVPQGRLHRSSFPISGTSKEFLPHTVASMSVIRGRGDGGAVRLWSTRPGGGEGGGREAAEADMTLSRGAKPNRLISHRGDAYRVLVAGEGEGNVDVELQQHRLSMGYWVSGPSSDFELVWPSASQPSEMTAPPQ